MGNFSVQSEQDLSIDENATHTATGTDATNVIEVSQASSKPRRKKRTEADDEELAYKVLILLEEGHPAEAIGLICDITVSAVRKIILTCYVKTGKALPAPSYTLRKSGNPIIKINELGISKGDYIKVTCADNDKVILEPFNLGEVNV